ncbi:MAG: nucleotidyltransferase family protein [Cyanobacteriota bacterium]|jgi:predicted nucleotidyltransferase
MTTFDDEQKDEIAAACRQYGIERLFVFGSAIREDFRPGESDIDLLVEFSPLMSLRNFTSILIHEKISGGSSMLMLTW